MDEGSPRLADDLEEPRPQFSPAFASVLGLLI
jgi:hypothetical protein